jgi:hypothetical protein
MGHLIIIINQSFQSTLEFCVLKTINFQYFHLVWENQHESVIQLTILVTNRIHSLEIEL